MPSTEPNSEVLNGKVSIFKGDSEAPTSLKDRVPSEEGVADYIRGVLDKMEDGQVVQNSSSYNPAILSPSETSTIPCRCPDIAESALVTEECANVSAKESVAKFADGCTSITCAVVVSIDQGIALAEEEGLPDVVEAHRSSRRQLPDVFRRPGDSAPCMIKVRSMSMLEADIDLSQVPARPILKTSSSFCETGKRPTSATFACIEEKGGAPPPPPPAKRLSFHESLFVGEALNKGPRYRCCYGCGFIGYHAEVETHQSTCECSRAKWHRKRNKAFRGVAAVLRSGRNALIKRGKGKGGNDSDIAPTATTTKNTTTPEKNEDGRQPTSQAPPTSL